MHKTAFLLCCVEFEWIFLKHTKNIIMQIVNVNKEIKLDFLF